MLVLFIFLHVLCELLYTFLAFLGTNLLTICHSVSSCFLLFLCFRKVVHAIFSEFHGTKTQYLIIPSRSRSQRGAQGGTRGGQTTPRRGLPSARARGVFGPTRLPPT